MSTQFQTQSKASNKSLDTSTANAAVKHHFSSHRGFSAETQRYQIQTKLKIGQPGDKYEQEADRIANAVMTMPDPALQLKPGRPFAQVPSCGEQELLQAKPMGLSITPLIQRQPVEEEEEQLQKKPLSNHPMKANIDQSAAKHGEEADRGAEHRMRMPETAVQREPLWPVLHVLQCGNELRRHPVKTQVFEQSSELIFQKEAEKQKEEGVRPAKESSSSTPALTPHLETQIDSMRDAGQPLPGSVRSFFEPRFGYDFSQVRINTGAHATESARALRARAFTVGRNITFGAGEFSPATFEGKRLLAHELTHVIQQQKAGYPIHIQRACGSAAIGTPTGCISRGPTFVFGHPFFKFDANCDRFAPGQEANLIATATTLPTSATIEVHGFASVDGDPTFNRNLSCARALKAQSVLTGSAGIAASRITGIFSHGPTPGPVADRRSVVIRTTSPPTITLTELGFTGDHIITSVPGGLGGARGPRIDDPDGSSPVWDTTGTFHPVAYTRGTAPTMFARFAVAPPVIPGITNGRVRAAVGGTIIGQQTGLSVAGTTIENTGSGTGMVTGIGGGNPIPGSGTINGFLASIAFEVSINGGITWVHAGNALVPFYFTVAAPTPPGGHLREDALREAIMWGSTSPASPEVGLRSLVRTHVFYDPRVAMPANFENTDAVMGAFTSPHQCDSQAYLLRFLARSIGISADVEYFWMGTSSEVWFYSRTSNPSARASFQCDRPAEDGAPATPHFTFHALTRIGGVLHDPSYDRLNLPPILEHALGATQQLGTRAQFFSLTINNRPDVCPH